MTFKHYLNFLSLPTVGKIRISEPFGFDGSSFKIKQDDKRFGRDVYIADQEIELEFTREEFERLNEPQRQLNGQVINHASLGFDYLLDVFQNEGWEGKVEHIIEDENNEQLDSCWGFLGDYKYCLEEAQSAADYWVEKKEKELKLNDERIKG